MLEPGMKCRVKKGTQIVPAGTVVVIDKGSGKNDAPSLITGKTGMIMAKMPKGGGLFFEESDLEPIS